MWAGSEGQGDPGRPSPVGAGWVRGAGPGDPEAAALTINLRNPSPALQGSQTTS